MAKSKMKKPKADHCTIRNENLFCTHCGGEHKISYPVDARMFDAMTKAFIEIHKNCPKTWQPPILDSRLTVKQRADWWLANGERGTSSETIFEIMDGRKILTYGKCHPLDPDDFRRCYLLLIAIPEWKIQLHLMKKVSPVWAKLVDNWDKLTLMLEEQLVTGKPNGMYQYMKELGC